MKVVTLVLLCVFCSVTFGQSGSVVGTSWGISGELFLNYNPLSTKPVFIRSQLPYEHWSGGWDVELNYKELLSTTLNFSVAGRAAFDNPERLDYGFRSLLHLNKKIDLLLDQKVQFNINNIPLFDNVGRIPHTGINNMLAGIQFNNPFWKSSVIRHEVFWAKTVRGNEPVFYNDFTAPYVGWASGTNLNFKFAHGDSFSIGSRVFASDRRFLGEPVSLEYVAKLRFKISKHVFWENGLSMGRNLVPLTDLSGDQKYFRAIGIISPARDSKFLWVGIRFSFD